MPKTICHFKPKAIRRTNKHKKLPHLEVLEHFLDHAGDAGFTVLGLTYSPIRGPEGNIEYLGYLEKGPRQERTFDLKALVDESHQTLKEHGEGGNP